MNKKKEEKIQLVIYMKFNFTIQLLSKLIFSLKKGTSLIKIKVKIINLKLKKKIQNLDGFCLNFLK